MLRTALPVTVELSLLAILIATVLGVGAGVVAAVRRGRPAEWLANALALLGLSVPNFWLGLMAILYLSVATGPVPGLGVRAAHRGPGGQPAPHHPAGGDPRHRPGRGDHAADPLVDAGRRSPRLRAHGRAKGLRRAR